MRIAPLLALVLFSAAAHGAPDAEVDRVVAARIDGDRSGVCMVAVRIAGLDRPGVLQAYLDMGKAHDLAGYEAALKRLQIPSFNIVYADRAGHVFHLSNGICNSSSISSS